MHKSENLFERIINLENLLLAWQEFKLGKSKKNDVQEFEMSLEYTLLELRDELRSQIWRPTAYQDFYVTDPKLRHIHKACVRDRVVHQAVFRVLYPIFEKKFIFDSYSCRIDKGTHKAVKRLETFCRKLSRNYRQNIFVLKCDIKKFFDSVSHEILRRLIAKEVSDEKVLCLVDLIIYSFSVEAGKGLPLGNVTSQLVANIYMNELDKFVKYVLKAKAYIRYTDDFVVVSKDRLYLESLIEPVKKFLNDFLQLQLHPKKVSLKKLSQGIDFLGHVVLPHHIVLRTKTKRRMLRKLFRKQALLKQGLLDKKHFNQSIQSYLGILRHCNGYKVEKILKNNFLN